MIILIGQPKLETDITQLEEEIQNHPQADLVIFPEGYLNHNAEMACQLARTYNKTIVTGYKRPKDWAVIIHRTGEILLDRAKYAPSPVVQADGMNIGFILCDELVLQGTSQVIGNSVDLLIHPIGVGMFSEDQFDEWTRTAREVARSSGSMIIGTSHADGSYRNCGVSIPIAYCFDRNGEEVFVSKDDTRTIILDTQTGAIGRH